MKNPTNIRVGDKIRILSMRGQTHYNGKIGKVQKIDGFGGLHGSWGSLALYPEKDIYEKIGLSPTEKANHLMTILIDNGADLDDAYVVAEAIWDLFEEDKFPDFDYVVDENERKETE
jgi:hypothetical protein